MALGHSPHPTPELLTLAEPGSPRHSQGGREKGAAPAGPQGCFPPHPHPELYLGSGCSAPAAAPGRAPAALGRCGLGWAPRCRGRGRSRLAEGGTDASDLSSAPGHPESPSPLWGDPGRSPGRSQPPGGVRPSTAGGTPTPDPAAEPVRGALGSHRRRLERPSARPADSSVGKSQAAW